MQLAASRFLKIVVLLSVITAGFCCKGGETTTTNIKNPEPPYQWYPFDDYPLTSIDRENGRTESFWNTGKLDPELYTNKFFDRFAADAACLSTVQSLTVNLTGQVTGNLRFNQGKRMKGVGTAELNNSNSTLGPVRAQSGFLERQFYKYEVVIVFSSLVEAFYGQMISGQTTGAQPQLSFHDDSPENDWTGLNWDLAPGEKKQDFPVFEVQGNTVRWIDAPQASTFPSSNYVIVYAGACGTVTHMAIIELSYPSGAPPSARTLTKDQFRAAVGGWSFEPPQ